MKTPHFLTSRPQVADKSTSQTGGTVNKMLSYRRETALHCAL